MFLALGIGALLLALGVLQTHSVRRRVAKRMQSREIASADEFGSRYFTQGAAPIATRLRVILARHIDIDLSRLHPNDRLIADLEMEELDSLSTVNFAMEIEQEFGITIPETGARPLDTFGDVVQYITDALSQPVA